MALILAIEPDPAQAEAVRRAIRMVPGLQLLLVGSREAALAALASAVPDLILLPALLSPGDETALMGALRARSGAERVQTLTIPLLETEQKTVEEPKKRGILDIIRGKSDDQPAISSRVDPSVFAREIRAHLERAHGIVSATTDDRFVEPVRSDPSDAELRAEFSEPSEPPEPPPSWTAETAVDEAATQSWTAETPVEDEAPEPQFTEEPSPAEGAAAPIDPPSPILESEPAEPRPFSVSDNEPPSQSRFELGASPAADWSGFRDPFGERDAGVDEDGQAIERLRLVAEFTRLEAALSDRLAQLALCDRPDVARTRRLERDEPTGRLVLVNERAGGLRLSELLAGAAERSLLPDLPAALFVVTRLLRTLRRLQAFGVVHAAVSAERVVVTPQGRVVVLEPAVGVLLEASGRRKKTPDSRLDIAGVALIGISTMLGRPIDAGQGSESRGQALAEAVDVAAIRGSDRFATALGSWFTRALGRGRGAGFADATEALMAFEAVNTTKDGGCIPRRRTLQAFAQAFPESESIDATLERDRLRALRTRQLAVRTVMLDDELTTEPSTPDLRPAGTKQVEEPAPLREMFAQPEPVRRGVLGLFRSFRARRSEEPPESAPEPIAATAPTPSDQAAPEPPNLVVEEPSGPRDDVLSEMLRNAMSVARPPVEEAVTEPEVQEEPTYAETTIDSVPMAVEPPSIELEPSTDRAETAFEEVAAPEFENAESVDLEEPAASIEPAPDDEPEVREPSERPRSLLKVFQAFRSRRSHKAEEPPDEPQAEPPAPIEPPQSWQDTPELASHEERPHPAPASIPTIPSPTAGWRESTSEPPVHHGEDRAAAPSYVVLEPPDASTPVLLEDLPAVADAEPVEPATSEPTAPPVAWTPPPASVQAPTIAPTPPPAVAAPRPASPPPAPPSLAPPPPPAFVKPYIPPSAPVLMEPVSRRPASVDAAPRAIAPPLRGPLTRKSTEDSSGRKRLLAGAAAIGGIAIVGYMYFSRPAGKEAPRNAAAKSAPVAAPTNRRSIRGAGSLVVTTEPAGARVQVDGKPRGVTPLTIDDLAPGVHAVVVESSEGSIRRSVRIKAGAEARLDESIYSGWVAVFAPFELQIDEGKRRIGSTESGRILMPPGRHDLVLTNTALGYRDLRSVEVNPGETTSINIKPAEGIIRISTTAGAEVWIDGERVGEAPLGDLHVPIGIREIVVRHPQLGEQRATANVTLAAPAEISIDLTKRPKVP